MVTDRLLTESDLPILAKSLQGDQFHVGTDVDFFTAPGSVCKVYEDEQGPVCFVRGTKALRLDIQYLDNNDRKRNMKVMLEGFGKLAQMAKDNGFTEIVFQTNNDLLKKFCIKAFGFYEYEGELRKHI